MAIVNVKSQALTQADSPTQNLNRTNVQHGRLYEDVATIEIGNADSIGSIYRFIRLRSTARVSTLSLSCDAITTAVADIGIYRTPADGGAVVDVDFYASAQALTAGLVNADVTHEADPGDAGAGFGLADAEKPLWMALGLPTDSATMYDIALTLTAAATGAGTANLRCRYVDNN